MQLFRFSSSTCTFDATIVDDGETVVALDLLATGGSMQEFYVLAGPGAVACALAPDVPTPDEAMLGWKEAAGGVLLRGFERVARGQQVASGQGLTPADLAADCLPGALGPWACEELQARLAQRTVARVEQVSQARLALATNWLNMRERSGAAAVPPS